MIFITCPTGASAKDRYLVAQVLPRSVRLARANHPAVAQSIAVEWSLAKYEFNPGEMRHIHTQEPHHA